MTGETEAFRRQAPQEDMPPRQVIKDCLSAGMHEAGELFDRHEFFLLELLLAAEVMHAGIEILVPSLEPVENRAGCETVMLGVVEGDAHEIGKNPVGVMLEAEGYEVIDLGYDVPPYRFIDEIEKNGTGVLALFTMMATLPNMRRTVEMASLLRSQPLVIVGSAPLSPALAEAMGADGYEDNAARAPFLLGSSLDSLRAIYTGTEALRARLDRRGQFPSEPVSPALLPFGQAAVDEAAGEQPAHYLGVENVLGHRGHRTGRTVESKSPAVGYHARGGDGDRVALLVRDA